MELRTAPRVPLTNWFTQVMLNAVIAKHGSKKKNFQKEDTKKTMKSKTPYAQNACKFSEKDTQYLKTLLDSQKESITFAADVILLSPIFLILEEAEQINLSFADVASQIEKFVKNVSSDVKGAVPSSQ